MIAWQERAHSAYIGFPGQIHTFDNRFSFTFIKIRQIMSCRENQYSNSFSYSVNFSVKGFCIHVIQCYKKYFTSIQIRDRTLRRHFHHSN